MQSRLNRDREKILVKLRDEFAQWEALLPTLTEAQIATQRDGAMTVKDEIAHLWAWQQISRAHVRAAAEGQPPVYPTWPVEIVPGAEGDLTYLNEWIYQTYRAQSWAEVLAAWRAGFKDFLALSEALPDDALFRAGKYACLGQYRLVDVLISSHAHHQEHRQDLLTWLQESEAA